MVTKGRMHRAVAPVLERPTGATFRFGSTVGERIRANEDNWLMTAPLANPAMLQMFYDRDRLPHKDMVPWAGEFAGKYLIAAVQGLRITKSARLRRVLKEFVADLIAGQGRDGYMGPWPQDVRMMQKWDLWGQYHCMLGLYLWHLKTRDAAALKACRRCADYFCDYFLDGARRVVEAGSEEMNESSIHVFTLLYQHTGERRYLAMARHIEQDWQTPPSGDHVRCALAGKAFWECPKPRWESLHGVQAIAELYFITGEQKYRDAYERIWWSIVEGDRHNNGGFSSGEKANGNPYDPAAIETCCTIAWMAVTQDMLRMTGDSRAADELELSTLNSVLGAQSPSGRWWTYNTPMDGERLASAHHIVFQARAGQPELNCCSVNAPRGLGILSEWAVMAAEDGVALNYYGPSSFSVSMPGGGKLRLTQKTDYPVGGKIELTVDPAKATEFALRFRIPGWSRKIRLSVNGRAARGVAAGTYKTVARRWRKGDRVVLEFDMSTRLWVGEKEQAGKVSLYRGPILLAYDPRFDSYDPTKLPKVDVANAVRLAPPPKRSPKPMLLARMTAGRGKTINLCDFASAGAGGNPYVSWLPVKRMKGARFSRENPLRLL